MPDQLSSTGISTRTASVLAYLGWWVTGLIFWGLERDDAVVRFHAAQSTIAFGALTIVIAGLTALGLILLSFAPVGFTVCTTAAAVTGAVALALWGVSLWKASQGECWRIPLAGRIAARATAGTIPASPSTSS